jgi:hypothetical protein
MNVRPPRLFSPGQHGASAAPQNFPRPPRLAALLLAALACVANIAHADVIIRFQEVGSDVVASFSGNVDLTGATQVASALSANVTFVVPAAPAAFFFRSSIATYDGWLFSSAPMPSFGQGTGVQGNFNLTTGGIIGVDGSPGTGTEIMLASGYTSGSPFAGTGTFENATFSSLGITPGTYTWTAGNNNMTITTQAVPEPATSAMALAGLAYGTYSIVRNRRRGC